MLLLVVVIVVRTRERLAEVGLEIIKMHRPQTLVGLCCLASLHALSRRRPTSNLGKFAVPPPAFAARHVSSSEASVYRRLRRHSFLNNVLCPSYLTTP